MGIRIGRTRNDCTRSLVFFSPEKVSRGRFSPFCRSKFSAGTTLSDGAGHVPWKARREGTCAAGGVDDGGIKTFPGMTRVVVSYERSFITAAALDRHDRVCLDEEEEKKKIPRLLLYPPPAHTRVKTEISKGNCNSFCNHRPGVTGLRLTPCYSTARLQRDLVLMSRPTVPGSQTLKICVKILKYGRNVK